MDKLAMVLLAVLWAASFEFPVVASLLSVALMPALIVD